MIELETLLHKFNPDHFGGIADFLKTPDSNERDTLMFACAEFRAGRECSEQPHQCGFDRVWKSKPS